MQPATASTVAEADGNRTRLTGILGHTDFEDQEAHQVPDAYREQSVEESGAGSWVRGGGNLRASAPCASPSTPTAAVARARSHRASSRKWSGVLVGVPSETLLIVGLDHGDDAAAVRLDGNGTAVLSAVDFFTPVVDDAYDWGRIAAANAFSDIYAMGGWPILAVNLVC